MGRDNPCGEAFAVAQEAARALGMDGISGA
jgi:hypothetical protein